VKERRPTRGRRKGGEIKRHMRPGNFKWNLVFLGVPRNMGHIKSRQQVVFAALPFFLVPGPGKCVPFFLFWGVKDSGLGPWLPKLLLLALKKRKIAAHFCFLIKPSIFYVPFESDTP